MAEPWVQSPAQESGCCFTYSVLSKVICLHRGRTGRSLSGVHTHSRTGTRADNGHAHIQHRARNGVQQVDFEAGHLAFLSREMPTVLCSLTRGGRKAVWPQFVKPTWAAMKGPVGCRTVNPSLPSPPLGSHESADTASLSPVKDVWS